MKELRKLKMIRKGGIKDFLGGKTSFSRKYWKRMIYKKQRRLAKQDILKQNN